MIANSQKKRNNTKLIFISVIALTILTLGVSYSAFFEIKVRDTYYSFNAGSLTVTTNGSSQLTAKELLPTPTTSLPTAATSPVNGSSDTYATLTIQNSGNLNAEFSVTISADTAKIPAGGQNLDFKYLNIGIVGPNNQWINFDKSGNTQKYYVPLSNLTQSSTGVYPILKETINAPTNGTTTNTYKIYIWVDQSTPTTEIGKLIYLKLDVKSTTTAGHTQTTVLPGVSLSS